MPGAQAVATGTRETCYIYRRNRQQAIESMLTGGGITQFGFDLGCSVRSRHWARSGDLALAIEQTRHADHHLCRLIIGMWFLAAPDL